MKYTGEERKIGGVVGAFRAMLLLVITILAYAVGAPPHPSFLHTFQIY